MESSATHFVKMDLLDGGAMNLCLGLRQAMEDADGLGFYIGWQVGRLDDGLDIAEVALGLAVRVFVGVGKLGVTIGNSYVHELSAKHTFHGVVRGNGPALRREVQANQHLLQFLNWPATVDKAAKKHIARQARGKVEIADHRLAPLSWRRLLHTGPEPDPHPAKSLGATPADYAIIKIVRTFDYAVGQSARPRTMSRSYSTFWFCYWLSVVFAACKATGLRLFGETSEGRFGHLRDFLLAWQRMCCTWSHWDWRGRRAPAGAAVATPRAVGVGRLRDFCNVERELYGMASIRIFAYLRTPLTYPLLYLAGDMKNMRSSVGAFITPPIVALLAGGTLAYVVVSLVTQRMFPPRATWRWRMIYVLAAGWQWLAFVLREGGGSAMAGEIGMIGESPRTRTGC